MDNNLHNISTKYFDKFDLSDNVNWFNSLFDESMVESISFQIQFEGKHVSLTSDQ
jgi:hypothetical protein